MRYLFVALLFCTVSFQLLGQESYDSLASDSLIVEVDQGFKLRGYVFLYKELSSVNSQSIEADGAGIAALINDKFIVGGFTSAFSNKNFTQRLIFPNQFNMIYKHGGVLLGYRFKVKEKFALVAENKVSWGQVRWQRVANGEDFLDSDMMIIQPSFGIDVNPIAFLKRKKIKPSPLQDLFRVNAHIGYRLMSGLDIQGLQNSDFNSLIVGLMLKVGYFK